MKTTLVHHRQPSKRSEDIRLLGTAALLSIGCLLGTFVYLVGIRNRPWFNTEAKPQVAFAGDEHFRDALTRECLGVWVQTTDGPRQDSGFLLAINSNNTFESWAARRIQPANGTKAAGSDTALVGSPDSAQVVEPHHRRLTSDLKWIFTSVRGHWDRRSTPYPDPSAKGKTYMQYCLIFDKPIEPDGPENLSLAYKVAIEHYGTKIQLSSASRTYVLDKYSIVARYPDWQSALEMSDDFRNAALRFRP